jgi:hypothetical protein
MEPVKYNFTKDPPFADNKSITSDELHRVLAFVQNGKLVGSYKNSVEELQTRLDEIGYNENCHSSYTFQYDWSNKKYAPDCRHIFIKELNKYFTIL